MCKFEALLTIVNIVAEKTKVTWLASSAFLCVAVQCRSAVQVHFCSPR